MSHDPENARELRSLEQRESGLANRAGGLAIAAMLLAVVSAMAMPATFRATERRDLRALSAAPLAGAAAFALCARSARRGLEEVRTRKGALLLQLAGAAMHEPNDAATVVAPIADGRA